eukprot:TRINITY_DN21879_c0_g1_i1.p1 TRINITY_DN21879_c0_g1~~TRINITY_DN21879_c0_g1_i1.p1  ORF type:complete len:376 (+),score=88.04 TRINITY_DN21879_c0_g1_i1:99-1226(+)
MTKRSHRKISEQQRQEEAKISTLSEILLQDPINVERLRHIAVEEGIPNIFRAKVWAKLLNVDPSSSPSFAKGMQFPNPYTDQVEKDVDRSLWRFTVGNVALRTYRRAQLSRVVNALLSNNPDLHYYQGYHDITSIVLLIADTEEATYAMMDRLSKNHIRFALNSTLETTKKILELLFPLISFADKELYQYFLNSQVEPFFALSWVLTWFSHGFDDLEIIARLFDLFIASHPLMPLYLGAQIILYFKDELLNNVECEYSSIHGFLNNIPQSLPFDQLIPDAIRLFQKCPPHKLGKLTVVLGAKSPLNNWPFPWMSEVQHPDFLRERYAKEQQKLVTKNLNLKMSPMSAIQESPGDFALVVVLLTGLTLVAALAFKS